MANRNTIRFNVSKVRELWSNKLKETGDEMCDPNENEFGYISQIEEKFEWARGMIKSPNPFNSSNYSFDKFSPEQVLFYELVLKPAEVKKFGKVVASHTTGGNHSIYFHFECPQGVSECMVRHYENAFEFDEMLRDLLKEGYIYSFNNEG